VSRPTPTEEDLDLLTQVWEADRVLDYPRIREMLSPLNLERVLASEEYTILLLYAYLRLGDGAEATALLNAAGSVFTPDRSDRNRIRFLCAAAEHAWREGRLAEAEIAAHEVLDVAHRKRDEAAMLHGLSALGIAAALRGDPVQSLRHFNRALPFRDRDSGRWISGLHHNLAVVYRDLGFLAESQRHFEEAARHPRGVWLEVLTTLERALLLHVVGDGAAAEALARLGLNMSERIQFRSGMAEARTVLARIAIGMGELDQARRELESALGLLQHGDALLAAQTHEEAAILALLSGDAKACADAKKAAEEFYRVIEAHPRIERMRLRLEVLSAINV
jgi:tetratricopeptide (TPR) repeat protein